MGSADGDFALQTPAPPVTTTPAGPPVPSAPAVPPAPVTVPAARAGSSSVGPGEPPAGAPRDVVAPPAQRTRPLHEPDHYSTPPYGNPGPWAPAPPVQHPGVPRAPFPQQGGAPGPVPAAAPPFNPPPAQASPGSGGHEVHDAATVAGVPARHAPADGPPVPSAAVDAAPDPWARYDPWSPVPLAGAVPPEHRSAPVRRAGRGLAVGAVVLALVSGGVGGFVGIHLDRQARHTDVSLPQAPREPAGRPAAGVAAIAARALPSVVTLHVSGDQEQDTGTGFVLDAEGDILTNNHVVEPAGSDGEIEATFDGGRTVRAEVVGRDSGYDLAVVKVTGVDGLTPMPLGNSDNVRVGDPVVAIGAPFDLAGTVTSGIISAKNRPITAGGDESEGGEVSYVDALQTDAPINPGNSGGPLLDAEARVVGVNSAMRAADDGSSPAGGQAGSIGLGFAIPVNQARRVAEELINTGHATHPVIGITLDMAYAGDGARVGTGSGAVVAGGPGDRAGIEPGDVVTAVDGTAVHTGKELIVRTRAHRPGDSLRLTLTRDGRSRTVTLVLGSSDSG
ncbi:trypsin-like peptidase domain-containing protein [Streptomyces sp. NPDC008150]|uniref:trypsin-like peptidase domain-containing protein n=1 Tax=Streptomyces sp. NPDC008150 TaxID=3364816 RepID=UPI0036EE2BE7